MSRIFLSHSSANNGPAVALSSWLKAEGWDDVFLDLDPDRGIAAGERWQMALNDAAYRCEAVLFLLSKSWLASDWCRREFDLAGKLNKRMFGVLIEDLAVADLPRELTGTWQVVNLAQGSDQKLFETAMPGGEVYSANFSLGALRSLKTGLVKAGLDPRFFDWPPAHDPTRPPYRGLLPMEAADAGIFYGREAPIIETLDKLRGLRQVAASRLLVILGASGSGKSSFLKAGILPRLTRDDRNFLVLPVVRPERSVLSGETGLARSLEKAGNAQGLTWRRADIDATIAGGGAALLELIAQLARPATASRLAGATELKPPTLVLAIDQGEELFQAEGGEEVQAFLLLLHDMLAARDANLIVIFTIRSDAYAALQSEPLLKDIHQQPLNLPPVPKGAYQTIIEGPALRLKDTKRALKIDPQLTAGLLADIETGGAKDALPLLAFTLERLYLEHGGDGDLRLEEYREQGGIAGSIEAAVEQALKDADDSVPMHKSAKLALLRRAFIPWLAGIDPDTGSPRRSIALLSDIPEEARPLIKPLIERRLLATDRDQNGETTVEPAHEALLRQWGLLKGWLEEDFVQLSTLEGVKRATRDWIANGKSPDWLAHNAGRLEDAERLDARPDLAAKLGKVDRDYLVECRAAEAQRKDRELRQAKRLTRAIAMGLVAAVVLAIAAAGFGYYGFTKANEAEAQTHVALQKSEEALKERQTAVNNEGVALSGLSRVALIDGYPAQAVKLALAAWPRTGDEDRPALRRAIESLGRAFTQDRQRLLLKGHKFQVNSVAFSPDGTRLLTAGGDRTARLWDAKTGNEIAVLKEHGGFVFAQFSPDGTSVLTASRDRNARLWDAKTSKEIAVLKGHKDYLTSAKFSADGMRVVTTSADKTARLWDFKTGAKVVLQGHEDQVTSAAFSPDGLRVVTTSRDKTARLWDTQTGNLIAILSGHEKAVTFAAFSPDGTLIVTAGWDGTTRLWDGQTGSQLSILRSRNPDTQVNSASFSPDGLSLVVVSNDVNAQLWNVRTGSVIATLAGHLNSLSSAAFSPDGTRVVTTSADRTARLWDSKTGTEIAVFKGHEAEVAFAAFSPDGMRMATAAADGTARVWDATAGFETAVVKAPEKRLSAIALSPDGKRMVTGSSDSVARVWDVQSAKEIAVLKGHQDYISAVAFSPDGTRILTASGDKTARVWDAQSGAQIAVLSGHTWPLEIAVFSPDGVHVLTTSMDKTARLWVASTGKEIFLFEGDITAAAFSPDGTKIVTGSQNQTVHVWDWHSGKELAVLRGHEASVSAVTFSPDGGLLATGGLDNTARLWDWRTGRELAVLERQDDFIKTVAFSPDGKRLLAGTYKGFGLWEVETGQKIAIVKGIDDSETFGCLTLAPDGIHVLACSNWSIRLWDAITGGEVAVLQADLASGIAVSPDGERIMSISSDDTIRLWDISSLEKGNALVMACARLGNDTDLADVRARYGLGEMVPICGKNAPLPADPAKLQ